MIDANLDIEGLARINTIDFNRVVRINVDKYTVRAPSGSETSEIENELQSKYDNLLKLLSLTNIQQQKLNSVLDIFGELVDDKFNISNLNFETSIENEVVITNATNSGISILSIDDEGDSLVSYAPYNEDQGWREFIDEANFDNEYCVYKFLS